MQRINTKAFKALRLQRQRLLNKVQTEADYLQLFRDLQPGRTWGFSVPGSPPVLAHRLQSQEQDLADALRSDRKIIKGRFGGVGYIFPDELPLFAAAYRKAIRFDEVTSDLLNILDREGPMDPKTLREISGYQYKEVAPRLTKLQDAFLIYEDQVDGSWDRAFYILEKEFPEADLKSMDPVASTAKLLVRATRMSVFSTETGLKAWFELPSANIKKALAALVASGELLKGELEGVAGYVLAEDSQILSEERAVPSCVFCLHSNDFLARMDEGLRVQEKGKETALAYVLVDGWPAGMVLGKWRQGPHDIHEIALTLEPKEAEARMDEILEVIQEDFSHLQTQSYLYHSGDFRMCFSPD